MCPPPFPPLCEATSTPHRPSPPRSNLATALIDHERIRTTVPKAKELKRVADKMVTFAKTGTQAARRHAAAFVQTPSAVDKLFTTLGPRYACVPCPMWFLDRGAVWVWHCWLCGVRCACVCPWVRGYSLWAFVLFVWM